MAEELARDPRATILNDVTLNQVLVRFASEGPNVTDDVIDSAQREGTCWMGGTTWDGSLEIGICVCNWRTTERHPPFRRGDPRAGELDDQPFAVPGRSCLVEVLDNEPNGRRSR